MPIMEVYPQVREGERDGEECSEKACPIPSVTPTERNSWPSVGGPNRCETISGMLYAQSQLSKTTAATATQQPRERCCEQKTNNRKTVSVLGLSLVIVLVGRALS